MDELIAIELEEYAAEIRKAAKAAEEGDMEEALRLFNEARKYLDTASKAVGLEPPEAPNAS